MLQLDQMNMINSLSLRCETIMSDPYNPIILAVSIFLVLSFILYCKEKGESSTTNLVTVNSTLKTDTKGKGKQVNDIVDVTYITRVTPSGITKRILFDSRQPSGERLKQLWPQRSYPSRDIPVNGVMWRGIELPEHRQPDIQLHGEIERAEGPMPIGSIGIWAAAHVRVPNLTVLTKGHPVETIAFRSPYSTNGTGQALKSFIIRN